MKEAFKLVKNSYFDIWKKKKELFGFAIILFILNIFHYIIDTKIEKNSLYHFIYITKSLTDIYILIKITEIFLEQKVMLSIKIFFLYIFASLFALVMPVLFISIIYTLVNYTTSIYISNTEIIKNISLVILLFPIMYLITRLILIPVNLLTVGKLEIKKTLSLTKNQKLNIFIYTIFIYSPILLSRLIDNSYLLEIFSVLFNLILSSFFVKYYKNRVSYI